MKEEAGKCEDCDESYFVLMLPLRTVQYCPLGVGRKNQKRKEKEKEKEKEKKKKKKKREIHLSTDERNRTVKRTKHS